MNALVALVCLLGGAGSSSPQPAPPAASRPAAPDTLDTPALTSYARAYASLRGARLDARRRAPVDGLVLGRGGAELALGPGTLLFVEPVEGRTFGAVFVGTGSFGLEPPLAIEREQLKRFLGATSARLDVRAAVLFFTDSTAAELERRLAFRPGEIPAGAQQALADALAFLESDDKDLDARLMVALLAGGPYDFFHVHLVPPKGKRFYFRVDEGSPEEVSFGREAAGRGSRYEVLSQYPLALASGGPSASAGGAFAGDAEDARDLVAIPHLEVEATIAGNHDLSARAVLHLESRATPGSWVPFRLWHTLRVDSARWETGVPAEVFRLAKGRRLWVRLPDDLPRGGRRQLSVWYRGGGLLRQRGPWVYLESSTGWYPWHGRGFATFNLTFRTPKKYAFMSVGEEVSREVTGNVVTSRWVTTFPSIHASFNLGQLEEHELTDPRIPPVKLQVAESAHERIADARRESGDWRPRPRGRDMKDLVGADLMNSISFFQTWFGPPPITRLHATEIPWNHGQAFPGLIHLSWLTFEGIDQIREERPSGSDEIFRAHEVAHQWWGLGVSPRTYHDAWLSEGLAEFSGLWYLHTVLRDPQQYLRRLEGYRREIVGRRGKAGPIWLGPRLYTSSTSQDYRIVVYQKGAWVIHMLRNLFLDLNTMDEDRFVLMLRELYASYAGGRLSTEEFRAHAERHLGIDLGWFFDQWVYGTEIPSYRVSYTGRKLEGGEYGVSVRVAQENVSPEFRMYVPLLLDFGLDGWARLRILVEGPVTEVELPRMPRRPDRIVFNDLHSVLAEVKEEGWRK